MIAVYDQTSSRKIRHGTLRHRCPHAQAWQANAAPRRGKKHLDVLAAEDLITDRPSYVMRAVDSTIVEVVEWRSAKAIAQAYSNPKVGDLWAEFREACDDTPLAQWKESQPMFAEFDSIAL